MSNARFSIIPSRAVFDPDLPRPALHVLNALGTYGDRGGWCRPSMATLGRHLGCSRQAISKQIKVLVERGYVEVSIRHRKDGGQSSHLYRIRFDVSGPDTETLADSDDMGQPEAHTPATPATPPQQPNSVAPPATSRGCAPPATAEVAPILERPSSYNAPMER